MLPSHPDQRVRRYIMPKGGEASSITGQPAPSLDGLTYLQVGACAPPPLTTNKLLVRFLVA